MTFEHKILSFDRLPEWREQQRSAGRRVVATNGCFDILHAGHVAYLAAARAEGDLLLVGVNDDAGVRDLKGPNRPVNSQNDRALVLAALECVDAVCVFPGDTATAFLRHATPDIYVKGGDYTVETLNPEERRVLESAGAGIVFIPFVQGKSTTRLIEKISTPNS